jgi:ABC-type dipeptide/oligopeptide/nickel transport system permease subunit
VKFWLLAAAFAALIAIGRWISPYDPLATSSELSLQPPSQTHLSGTDLLGRDVFSRALHGGSVTVFQAGLSAGIALSLGVLTGLRKGDGLMNGFLDALIQGMLAIPGLMLSFTILTLLGNMPISLTLAVAVAQIAPVSRMTRQAAQTEARMLYVEAARSYGADERYLVWRHILPNVMPAITAYGCVTFGYCVLNGAALTFLGFGGEPGRADWGVMLYEAWQVFRVAPWVGILPGLGIMTTVLLMNEAADRIMKR